MPKQAKTLCFEYYPIWRKFVIRNQTLFDFNGTNSYIWTMKQQDIIITAMGWRELSQLLNQPVCALKRWYRQPTVKEKIGEKVGHKLSVNQVEMFVQQFGVPYKMKFE